MAKQRIIETNEGIQGILTVQIFDRFARDMRDKGWNNVDSIIKALDQMFGLKCFQFYSLTLLT